MENIRRHMPQYPLNHAGQPSGIGLRAPHFEEVLREKPPVGFLEAHSENYFRAGSVPFEYLMRCRETYPVSLHGVGLSLGSADGVSEDHLRKLKQLVLSVEPALVSDHISWSRIGGVAVPDLLPLPLTKEALDILCANIDRTQDFLERTILVENPSACLAFTDAEMTEPEFITQALRRTGCGLLLDVNNIHVGAGNLGFDPFSYIDALPQDLAIGEIHLAGFQENIVDGKALLVDAHNHPVYDAVWPLYRHALARFGDVPTLVEWDNDLPALSVLVAEAAKADLIRKNFHARAS